MSSISREDFMSLILKQIEDGSFESYLSKMKEGDDPLFKEGFISGMVYSSLLTVKLPVPEDFSEAASKIKFYLDKELDFAKGDKKQVRVIISRKFWAEDYPYEDTLRYLNKLEEEGYQVEYVGARGQKENCLANAESFILTYKGI